MKEIQLPPPVCARLCNHPLDDRCMEVCLPKGDMELLEVKRGVTIDDLPRKGEREGLKWKARVVLAEVTQDVLINHLLGKGEIYTTIDFIQERKACSHVS